MDALSRHSKRLFQMNQHKTIFDMSLSELTKTN